MGIDYFLLNFFGTFGSVLGLQVTLDCRLTLDCGHRHAGSHLLQAQCCVALNILITVIKLGLYVTQLKDS